eukprot:gene23264-biopygen20805
MASWWHSQKVNLRDFDGFFGVRRTPQPGGPAPRPPGVPIYGDEKTVQFGWMGGWGTGVLGRDPSRPLGSAQFSDPLCHNFPQVGEIDPRPSTGRGKLSVGGSEEGLECSTAAYHWWGALWCGNLLPCRPLSTVGGEGCALTATYGPVQCYVSALEGHIPHRH